MKNITTSVLFVCLGVFSASSSYSYLNIDRGQVGIAISIVTDFSHPHYQNLGALAQAVQQSRMPISMSLHHQFTLLHLAAVTGWLEGVRFLLDRAAEVDAVDRDQRTPLHYAAFWGYREVIRVLLEHQASTNARCSEGMTPLHIAAAAGHLEVVVLLVNHGAQVEVRTHTGRTPFSLAFQRGHGAVFAFLVHCILSLSL